MQLPIGKQKWILAFLCALLSVLNVVAQKDFPQRDFVLERDLGRIEWKTGTIQLNDQTVINCLLSYNHFKNILTFKTADGIEEVSAQEIQQFSVEDGAGTRNFISSPKGKVVNENPPRFFFEVLVECDSFKLVKQEVTSASSNSVWKNEPGLNGGYFHYLGDGKMLIFEESGNVLKNGW